MVQQMLFLSKTVHLLRIDLATLIMIAILLSSVEQLVTIVRGLSIGDRVCVEGYIMDQYCINLGYLLDNPAVVTLENPGAHSVHCLIDVGVCRESDYVVLLEPGSTNSPISSPVPSLTPTMSLTKNPATKVPTISPTKPPTINSPTKAPSTLFSFTDIFSLLPGYTRPSAAPTTSPMSNDDDFFSILNLPKENVIGPSSQIGVRVVNSSLYTAGYVVDAVGKDLLIRLGRTVGICSTCGTMGSLRFGLRAELRGTITEISTIGGPHKLAVSSVQLSTNVTKFCQSPSGSTITTGTRSLPTQSPNLRSTNGNGLFSRFQDIFDSIFNF